MQAFFSDAVASTVVHVKESQGQLYWLNLVNTTAAAAYLQIFALPAASVTLGTTVPTWTIRLLASATVSLALTPGILFVGGTGLSLAGTTTATGSTGAAISVSALFA